MMTIFLAFYRAFDKIPLKREETDKKMSGLVGVSTMLTINLITIVDPLVHFFGIASPAVLLVAYLFCWISSVLFVFMYFSDERIEIAQKTKSEKKLGVILFTYVALSLFLVLYFTAG